MDSEKLADHLHNGETEDDLMNRVANVVYEIDPDSIPGYVHPLHGLRETCE